MRSHFSSASHAPHQVRQVLLSRALAGGGQPLRRSKVMTVGRGRAGKSALHEAMLHNTFTQAGLPSTVGMDLVTCHVHADTDGWDQVTTTIHPHLNHEI